MKMQKGSICYKRKEKLLPAPNPIGGKMATKGDEMPAPISLDVYIEDNFGKVQQITFNFNKKQELSPSS
ncbi:hypothetical protein PG_0984 [Porphyromonas gingivalis W83]|uniref:Uncharacterized protein n=3 Tax=Porphyromonas gingivalis TaxID=837 RepID=Q7MVR2_PORGI|nr:hypothetical protein PG_0984 [Porphyromonas gingivalis W83]ERJ63764.1 hypothetical protein HMPREF1554_02251 [Porphyromonas gingivalis F0569]ERJ65551.1 hypothetical protein HMPREF1555_01369 [Porphyromonas gingivalis F0570]ERJ86231.1 hypothetical protein HMPREF1988_00099 [Porphyromonas gingivalis F0185]ERJ90807.1 hypothetical protein HMPREF1990_00474 [Porphyromonas gingivalis W4087]PDP63140.1 hypothetical protein CLI83_01755 [Porphyromonas gingivalis]